MRFSERLSPACKGDLDQFALVQLTREKIKNDKGKHSTEIFEAEGVTS